MNIQSKVITSPLLLNNSKINIYYEIDRFINEVFINGEYVKALLASKVLDRDNLVLLDLGCNIGSFSFSIYDLCKSIYAVDLSTNCIEILNKTIASNNLSKITTYNCAIGDENTIVYPSSLYVTDGSNTINGGKDPIQSYTLNTFCLNNHISNIDLLKIDVEGAETAIFSAPDFSLVASSIGCIIGEIHSGQVIDTHLTRNNFTVKYKGSIFYAVNNSYAHSSAPD